MKKVTVIIGLATLAAACATTKTLQAVGGSRADGVVRLAYTYGMFEKPNVDTAAALQTAKSRCAVWGFTDAEPFGGAMQQCLAMGQYGCTQTQVTVEYQCTGSKAPAS